jgi:soluble lytic murein transglycosylase-like protein
MKVFIFAFVVVCLFLAYRLALIPDIGFVQLNLAFTEPKELFQVGPVPPAPPRVTVDTHTLIRLAAQRYRVPAAFVSSIIAAESNFNRNAVSGKGALGLMQLMPGTAKELGADPNIPEQNVDAGTHYLRVLMDKYQGHANSLTRVIAAYNAGPGMVDRYHGVPPFRETRRYVVRVLHFMRLYQKV